MECSFLALSAEGYSSSILLEAMESVTNVEFSRLELIASAINLKMA